MKEKKTVFKLFFVWDFEKEERWLNEMAQEGWVLDNTGFSFYTFVRCEPGEYIIRLEMNPSSDYRAFVKELGAEYIGGCVNWVYFRRKAELGSFELLSDIDSRLLHDAITVLRMVKRQQDIIGRFGQCKVFHTETLHGFYRTSLYR